MVLEEDLSPDEVERRKREAAAARGDVLELLSDEEEEGSEEAARARALRTYRAECKAEDVRRAALGAQTDWCVPAALRAGRGGFALDEERRGSAED